MSKIQLMQRYKSLARLQRKLERPRVHQRNHKTIADVVRERLGILERSAVAGTVWAHNERCKMEGRPEDMHRPDRLPSFREMLNKALEGVR